MNLGLKEQIELDIKELIKASLDEDCHWNSADRVALRCDTLRLLNALMAGRRGLKEDEYQSYVMTINCVLTAISPSPVNPS